MIGYAWLYISFFHHWIAKCCLWLLIIKCHFAITQIIFFTYINCNIKQTTSIWVIMKVTCQVHLQVLFNELTISDSQSWRNINFHYRYVKWTLFDECFSLHLSYFSKFYCLYNKCEFSFQLEASLQKTTTIAFCHDCIDKEHETYTD